MTEDRGYILTEIWSAKPPWLALPDWERQRYFDEKIGPFIGSLIEQGAEILGCAVNDNTGPERLDHRYMAVWRLPDKAFSEKLEAGAREAGFLDYFEQVNFSGSILTPHELNSDMIQLRSS